MAKSNPLLDLMHDTAGRTVSIKSLSEMLLRTKLTDEQKQFVDRIVISADHLNAIIDDYYNANKAPEMIPPGALNDKGEFIAISSTRKHD